MLYYFDIRKDGHLHRDEFGIELASDAVARQQAQGLAVEIVKICGLEGERSTIRIEAHRGDGDPVCVASFEMACPPVQGFAEAGRLGRAAPAETGMLLTPHRGEGARREGVLPDGGYPPPNSVQ